MIYTRAFVYLSSVVNKSTKFEGLLKLLKMRHSSFYTLLVLETLLVFGSCVRFSMYSREALRLHNKRRVQPLQLDQRLCIDAQQHADRLAREDGFIYHDNYELSTKQQSENLAISDWGGLSAEEAIKAWYDEKMTGAHCMGHYVAAQWRGSKKFCQVKAKSRTGTMYVVARYYPGVGYSDRATFWCNKRKAYEENIEPGFRLPTGCWNTQPINQRICEALLG